MSGQQSESMVRIYKDPKDLAKDVKKLSKQGWIVVSTVEHQPQSGFTRTMIGLGMLGSKPKPEMIVTFQRNKGGPVSPTIVVQAPPQEMRQPIQLQAGHCPNCGNPVSPTAYYCPSCRHQIRN